MSGDRTTPRFEVIASTRRSWSREQKRVIVDAVGVDDATLSDVARRHGIHTSLLFRWRRELEAEAPQASQPALSFVPVMLAPPATPMPTAKAVAIKPGIIESGIIEIVIAGGRPVRVGPDVDASALLRIIAALESSR